jgi:hypothetical protein
VDDDAFAEFPDLLGEVCRRYGLGGSPTARRLTGGYANDVIRVDCVGEAPVVLHIKHPPSSAESVDWEHRQVRALSIASRRPYRRGRRSTGRPGSGTTTGRCGWFRGWTADRPHPRTAGPSPWCWVACTLAGFGSHGGRAIDGCWSCRFPRLAGTPLTSTLGDH